MPNFQQLQQELELALGQDARIVLLLSFGKDSLLLLHALKQIGRDFDCVWFDALADKRMLKWAEKIIARDSLRVYSCAPADSFFARLGEQLYLVEGYSVNGRVIPALVAVDESGTSCGLAARGKVGRQPVKGWTVALSGARCADYTKFGGSLRPAREHPGLHVLTPLWEWTDADVWREIAAQGIETDAAQYERHEYDADEVSLCTRCFTTEGAVHCPLTGGEVMGQNAVQPHHADFVRSFFRGISLVEKL